MHKRPDIPRFDPTRPFSRADARRAGIPVHELGGPRYPKVMYDAYVHASVRVTTHLKAEFVLSCCDPAGHASHQTAARLWRAWVPQDPDVHVSTQRGTSRTKRRGVKPHVSGRNDEVVVHRGLRVSSPVQTFLDLARPLSLVDLVVLGDSLVHRGLATPDDLIQAAERWTGHGARLACRAARLVRVGVDSPMETRLRMLVVLAGLPEPVVNHILYHEDGAWRVRFDLSYPQWKIAIEYDGRHHAESEEQWQHDIERREDLDRLGWRLIIVRAPDIYAEPERTLARIMAALAERGVRGVRIRGEEWRAHFPGRAAAA